MTMTEWAEKEVELACKRENPDRKEGEWDYGCACYESALKAYKSLAEDGHSGFSFSMTRQILERLMRGLPLTPIEDTDDNWNDCSYGRKDGAKHYQCKRKSSLFKDVHPDGRVEYHDIDRIVCFDINDPDYCYRAGFISKICAEMFPIKFPYIPEDTPYKVYNEVFLVDEKNGGYDTNGILYIITPGGERVEVNRYFKESDDGFVEINGVEYLNRKEMRI